MSKSKKTTVKEPPQTADLEAPSAEDLIPEIELSELEDFLSGILRTKQM